MCEICGGVFISIHAPRMGSDVKYSHAHTAQPKFQSTLPAWGATCGRPRIDRRNNISIHAPRMGSDTKRVNGSGRGKNFNPRSPHGERPSYHGLGGNGQDFNPRSPHGERQLIRPLEGDLSYFNPRSPHGERQYSQSIQQ